jgi:hypothetical protein
MRGTNPNRWKHRRDITKEPSALARRGIPQRGELLKQPTGQQVLQATLLEIFAHASRNHPWNPTGRTLTGLFECYGSWISPQPDRIIMGSTLAPRMASYLLPHVKERNGWPECRGIPGLRHHGLTRHGYELLHLPTETVIEIRDRYRASLDLLEFEVRDNRDDKGYEPVWRSSGLSDLEDRWADVWLPTSHTSLYSAFFPLLPVLDRRMSARDAAIVPAPAETARAHLSWCGTTTPAEAVAYLNHLSIDVYGEPLAITSQAPGFAIVGAGGISMELHQRAACIECQRSYSKWEGRRSAREERRQAA